MEFVIFTVYKKFVNMKNLLKLKEQIKDYKHLQFVLEKEDESELHYRCMTEDFSFKVSEEKDGTLVFTSELKDKRDGKIIPMNTKINSSMLFSGVPFKDSESFVASLVENYFKEQKRIDELV